MFIETENMLLNTDSVSMVTANLVKLITGETIPISERDYNKIVQTLQSEERRLFALRCPR